MTWMMTIRLALRALQRNKMRSFLTTLGIIIGVFAVIAMVAVGEGAKSRVEASFNSMGSNMLILLPGTSSRGGALSGFGTLPTITWDDLKAIRTEAPAVQDAAAYLRVAGQVQSEEQNWTTSISGTSPEFFRLRDWPVTSGRLFGQSDMETGAKVAVLGRTVADKLYGSGSNPVGQIVRVKNVPFQIIGVLNKKGQSVTGQDHDDALFMPQTTFQSKIQGGLQKYIQGMVLVRATSSDTISKAQSQVSSLLRDRHHIQPGDDDDFSFRNLTELAGAFEAGASALAALLAAIAAVSLLVGGIGIMNIMLVSVTERTREIGIRMAIGAKSRNILAQFLAESLALSVIGGLIGVLLGLLTARALATRFGWPMVFRPEIVALAVGFSALVGVVFGIYPAHMASRLDPIEALRYE